MPIRSTMLSGALQDYGEQTQKGFTLGLEYCTDGTMEVAGRPIEVIWEDTTNVPDVARERAIKLLDQDKVDILVGCASSSDAAAVVDIAENWRDVTNGTDGLTFRVPGLISDRTFFYYFALGFLIVMIIVLRRFISSPTGKVIVAIRENEQRAEFLGYRIERYKMIAIYVAGISAGLSGLMFGTFNRFANTELLSIAYSTNALLYTLIGGTGTLYGGILGSWQEYRKNRQEKRKMLEEVETQKVHKAEIHKPLT